ncbi:MAG: phenylalanine--tRNA ligase subunit beta [Planctomycetota bacterium]
MIVSWNWLKDYVSLEIPSEELERRLMLAGLNHESTEKVADDLAIDLEVTSNRPDCLGHLGIAREAAVLFGRELKLPSARPAEKGPAVESLTRVRIDCPDLCYRYTARVIRGAKVGESPAWMKRRLETLGIAPINNVVDISNYVMMECGQPLHTFDMARLRGPEIIVRRPLPGERIEAIDHHTYDLAPEMCVIADAKVAVAIGGVMGGAGTEISTNTRDILVEAAEFNPLSIRNTARKLNLHSDSSYRFERKIDPAGVDWASRRCCELILELCGGELAEGVIDVGRQPPERQPIVLRFSQLKRILGIEVPPARVREILAALGNREVPLPATGADAEGDTVCVVPPSWRRDLMREIDLVEEVARIHGYDAIPEDVSVPMAPSVRTRDDLVLGRIRHTLTGCGFDEAMTISVVDESTANSMSPWTAAKPLQARLPVLRGADRLRRTLVPSLLGARQTNEALANPVIELFEIARVYWPQDGALPQEEPMLALTSGRDYLEVKGVIEVLVTGLRPAGELASDNAGVELLEPGASCRLLMGGEMIGFVGSMTRAGLKQFGLRSPTVVAELKLAPLVAAANLVPKHAPLSNHPAVSRDLNLVVDERIRWADIATSARRAGGACLESLAYLDTYRDPQRLGAGKKSLLLSISLRSAEATLTSGEADAIRDRIIEACGREHGAELRA